MKCTSSGSKKKIPTNSSGELEKKYITTKQNRTNSNKIRARYYVCVCCVYNSMRQQMRLASLKWIKIAPANEALNGELSSCVCMRDSFHTSKQHLNTSWYFDIHNKCLYNIYQTYEGIKFSLFDVAVRLCAWAWSVLWAFWNARIQITWGRIYL